MSDDVDVRDLFSGTAWQVERSQGEVGVGKTSKDFVVVEANPLDDDGTCRLELNAEFSAVVFCFCIEHIPSGLKVLIEGGH